MYLEFFKFKKSPFHITPDPDFLFLSQSHKEASASIFYGIESRKGFIAVTGEVGVGKTTILRSYLEGTDQEKIRIVYIFNAALSFDRLLKLICSELGIGASGEDPAELVDILFHYLIEEYKKDHNVVLIVDEAQNMPVETLERLRMLSNLETSRDKLIQIILVGQPEFDARLDLPELRQLKQRIAIRSRIEPLTTEESISYVQHRLMRASSFHNQVFTKKALNRIIEKANGIPRTINILCDNALVTGFGYQRKPVDERVVKEVVRDFQGAKPRSGFSWKFLWAPVLAACLGAAFFVSRGIVSDRRNHAPVKPSIRPILREPLPATCKLGSAKAVRTVENVPVAKKAPAVAGVDRDIEAAAKPKATHGVDGAKSFAGKAVEGTKVAANADVNRTAISVPTNKPAPAAPGAPATGGDKASSGKPSRVDPAPSKPPVQSSGSPSMRQPGLPVVVRQGDSVSKLLLGVHGRTNAESFKSFKELNPQIKDINRLLVGEKILLPRR